MTEEEYFRKNYPDFCYGDKPLSPYWDLFEYGAEFGERQSEKKIEELEQQIEKMKADVKQGQSYWNSGEMQYDLYQRLLDKWEKREND